MCAEETTYRPFIWGLISTWQEACMNKNIATHGGIHPHIPESAYIHHSAQVIGDVVLGENSSVWPMAVIRGDVNRIRIGNNSNVQDLCMFACQPSPPGRSGWRAR
jgi:UDP-3-O-[3-hydroxymyristoyl] glucosamine N-acyltransferase